MAPPSGIPPSARAPADPGARAGSTEPALLVGARHLGAPLPSGVHGSRAIRRAGIASLADGRPRRPVLSRRRFLVVGLRHPVPAIAAWPDTPDARPGTGLAELVELARERLLERLEDDPLLTIESARPSLARTCAVLSRIARTPLSVLILGETGAGKEVTARALHDASRRAGPFVAENCAALPEGLLESELFGVRRGAYTGATRDRPGRIASADHGTLFLDEIGDVPPSIQAKLLRVLQEREVRALGDDHARAVDVRFVSATHRDLPGAARCGEFRTDLYYRLAGVTVRLPPLRETPSDLPYVSAALLDRAVREGLAVRAVLTPSALSLLALLRLRGNVRELDNILRRALAFAGNGRIEARTFEAVLPELSRDEPNLEAHLIIEAFEMAHGVKAAAARHLGWSRQKLYRRIAALGLEDRLAWPSACERSRSRSS